MLMALHEEGGAAARCRRRSRHMGPHRTSTQIKGETSTQKPPRRTYAQPLPIAEIMGFIMDTMPAPIKQRTTLFCQDGKLRTFIRPRRKGHTQAVIEDPCWGTRSTSNAVIAFITLTTVAPTTRRIVKGCIKRRYSIERTDDLQNQGHRNGGLRLKGPAVTYNTGGVHDNKVRHDL